MKLHRSPKFAPFVERLGSSVYDTLFPLLGFSELDRDEIAEGIGADNIFFHGSESSLRLVPPSNRYCPDIFQDTPSEVKFPQPFVAEFEDAILLGSDAIGMTADKQLITETTYRSSNITDSPMDRAKLAYDVGIDGRFGHGSSTTIAGPCLPLIDQWSHGFFHWIADQLTKLQSAEAYQKMKGEKPTLLIESNPPSWKTETLELLGFDQSDWQEWEGSVARCERLLVPSHRRLEHYISPNAIEWLRKRTLSNMEESSNYSERVYVSREDASRRRVLNEMEIIDELSDSGYESYTLSDLSFREQVRLFTQAEVVLGPHGAGFTNTIFSNDITLLEFFGSNQQSRSLCYYGISNAKEFDYRAVRGDSDGENLVVKPSVVTSALP